MKNKTFSSEIDNIYNTLSDEQKTEYLCKENRANK